MFKNVSLFKKKPKVRTMKLNVLWTQRTLKIVVGEHIGEVKDEVGEVKSPVDLDAETVCQQIQAMLRAEYADINVDVVDTKAPKNKNKDVVDTGGDDERQTSSSKKDKKGKKKKESKKDKKKREAKVAKKKKKKKKKKKM